MPERSCAGWTGSAGRSIRTTCSYGWLPTFWVARIGEILQLLSGSVILIEILGKERVERAAGAMREVLYRLAGAEPLRHAMRIPWVMLTGSRSDRRAAEVTLLGKALATVAIVLSAAAILVIYIPILDFTKLPPALVAVLTLAAGPTIATVLLYGVAALFITAAALLYPVGFVFDAAARSVVWILGRRKTSDILLIASFMCLILGSLLDLAVS